MIVPDCVRETFTPKTTHGGEDGPDGRGLRYLEWIWDSNPADTRYEVEFAFLLRESGGVVRVDRDRHQFGLFPRAAWFEWLREVGFTAESRLDRWNRDVFLARKPRLRRGSLMPKSGTTKNDSASPPAESAAADETKRPR